MSHSTITQMRNYAIKIFLSKNIQFKIEDLTDSIHFEPSTRNIKALGIPASHFDGKQIIYWKADNRFELSEYQAGDNNNELHILAITKTFKAAISKLTSGKQIRPIKIYR